MALFILTNGFWTPNLDARILKSLFLKSGIPLSILMVIQHCISNRFLSCFRKMALVIVLGGCFFFGFSSAWVLNPPNRRAKEEKHARTLSTREGR